MAASRVLVALVWASVVYSGDAACTPAEIPLTQDNVLDTSHDRFYQPGDILYRKCTEPSTRLNVGWCPAAYDISPKLQVNLPHLSVVHSIEFQQQKTDCPNSGHNYKYDAHLERFALHYVMAGDTEGTLLTYSENLTALSATSFDHTERLAEPFVTSTLRIVPTSSNMYPCFRFRVIGCQATDLCAANWCLNGGSCAGKDYCTCAPGYFGDRCNQTVNDVEQQDYSFLEIVNGTLDTPAALFDVVGNVTLLDDPSRKRDHHHHSHHSCHFHSHHGHSCHLNYNHGHPSYHSSHHSSHSSHGPSHCMSHISSHHHGFTTSVNVHFHHGHHGHAYIYSNGGHLPGHHGATLSYHNNFLHFQVSTGTHHWTVSHPCNLQNNNWHNIATSWHPQTGAQLVINNTVVGTVTTPKPTSCQTGCTKSVNLQIGSGHLSLGANVNINFSLKGLVMYALNRLGLTNLGIPGPYTPAPPTMPAPSTTTPAPTTTTPASTTTTPKPTTTLVTATAKTMSTKSTPPTTTAKHGPMCYSYQHESKIGGSSNSVRCQYGEVCTLYKDKTGYTAKCLPKPLCDSGKRLAGAGQCWECCNSYLCNDNCAASAVKQCQDKPSCATMLATGYNVCNNTLMAVDMCRKHCHVC